MTLIHRLGLLKIRKVGRLNCFEQMHYIKKAKTHIKVNTL